MKKIVAFIILACTVLTFTACADNSGKKPATTTPKDTTAEDVTPAITLQEVYEAGKDMNALLGDHENVYVVGRYNGKLIREEFYCKEYGYTFNSAEYLDMGFDSSSLMTEHAEYVCIDGAYYRTLLLSPSGTVGLEEYFSFVGEKGFISSLLLNNESPTITEKDGVITVTCTFDGNEIADVSEGEIASCVETYTLDAKTREMTSVKTVYTYKNGTTEEGILTVTRDVELPEGVKKLVELANETEELRTVTVVSNPGTDDEKTESIQIAKGVLASLSSDFVTEQVCTVYTDAACTQIFEGDTDADSDLTVYIKWDE